MFIRDIKTNNKFYVKPKENNSYILYKVTVLTAESENFH